MLVFTNPTPLPTSKIYKNKLTRTLRERETSIIAMKHILFPSEMNVKPSHE